VNTSAQAEKQLAAFQSYLHDVFQNPCENSLEFIQEWEECGFGCALNAYVNQILESYFRDETFTLGIQHLDYHRYFRNAFSRQAFPICNDPEKLRLKPKQTAMNPHNFFKKRIRNEEMETRMRPLIGYAASRIWASMLTEIKNYVFYSTVQASLPKPYTAIHVRRDDKCEEEANCVSFEEYAKSIENINSPIFLMTDEKIGVLKSEIDLCCPDAVVFSLEKYHDSLVELPKLIAEIVVATRAEEIVCTGSSNICRLMWALAQGSTHIRNIDTTSILCGDARNSECIIENADVDHWELQHAIRQNSIKNRNPHTWESGQEWWKILFSKKNEVSTHDSGSNVSKQHSHIVQSRNSEKLLKREAAEKATEPDPHIFINKMLEKIQEYEAQEAEPLKIWENTIRSEFLWPSLILQLFFWRRDRLEVSVFRREPTPGGRVHSFSSLPFFLPIISHISYSIPSTVLYFFYKLDYVFRGMRLRTCHGIIAVRSQRSANTG